MARIGTGTHLAERLAESYALEADIYHRLLDLSRRQGEFLAEQGDVDACAGLFEIKDELLHALAEIEEQIEPLKRRWWSEEVAPATRERLNAQLDTVLETIAALMEQEQLNEQLLLQCSPEPTGTAVAGGTPFPSFVDLLH